MSEAMVGPDVPAQGFEQFTSAGFDTRADVRSKRLGIALAGHDGVEHGAPALAQDVAEYHARSYL